MAATIPDPNAAGGVNREARPTSRYTIQPADRKVPDGAWYVFDNAAKPPSTKAVCPGGAVDASDVKAGLEILELNRRLVWELFGVRL